MLLPYRGIAFTVFVLLGLSVPLCVLAGDHLAPADDLPEREMTPTQALQDLAVVIECRAPTSVKEPLAGNLWRVVLGGEPQPQPAFHAWKGVKQPNISLREVTLPAPITVFGHRTRRIAVLSEATMAIIDGVSLEDVSDQLGLAPLSVKIAPHIHLRELSLRNSGDIGFYVRSLTASRVTTHPDAVLVGCEERFDTRTEQLRRRGREPATDFAPGLVLAEELDEVLTCKADALRNYTARWAMAMGPLSNDPRFTGWKSGTDSDDNRWWTPPAPIIIAGKPVSRFMELGLTLYAELDGNIAEALAKQWDIPPYDGWDEVAFVGVRGTDIAADGWHEGRSRITLEWKSGKTLHGCEYTQHRPEFGETPDDDSFDE